LPCPLGKALQLLPVVFDRKKKPLHARTMENGHFSGKYCYNSRKLARLSRLFGGKFGGKNR